MQIVLVLVVLAVAVLLTCGAVLLGSLLLGGILLTRKRARVLVPVFFLLIPATILGGLAGGVILGYLAVRANGSLSVLGPLGGLIAGAFAGCLLGTVGAVFWWRRMPRSDRADSTRSGPSS